MAKARADYESKKAVSSEAHAHYKQEEFKVLELLKKAELENFKHPEFGTVSTVNVCKVKMPKEFDDKKALLDFLASKGEDVLLSYFTVNHNSLNSFYNQELEEAQARGELLNVPGLDLPVAEKQLRFRRSK